MKMERKLNKMYAGAIALMMVSIIFASVFATRTFTDSNDTWTGTIVQSGNLDFKSGAYFNLSNKIYCTGGKLYNASFIGLQAACYSMNSTGGKVSVPIANISMTGCLYVPSNVWVQGQGNKTILYLANSVNKSVIRNVGNTCTYHTLSGTSATGIRISDLMIDGNGNNQPYWISVNIQWSQSNGIFFSKTNDSMIDHVTLKRIYMTGISWIDSSDVTIDHCWFNEIGYEIKATGADCSDADGIWMQTVNRSVISHCIFNDVYADCIVYEDLRTSGFQPSKNFAVSDCVMSNAFNGVWCERSNNGTIDNCVATQINYIQAYAGQDPRGYTCGYKADNVSFSNCESSYAGSSTSNNGFGFSSIANDTSIIDCRILNTVGTSSKAISIGGLRPKISDNTIINYGGYGMYLSSSYEPDVHDNTLLDGVGSGIYITGTSATNTGGSIHHNIIKTITGTGYGIYNELSYLTIDYNTVYNVPRNSIRLASTAAYCDISHNTLTKIAGNGGYHDLIKADVGTNHTISFNIITNQSGFGVGAGIKFGGITNCTIIGNRVTLCYEGIEGSATEDWNDISHNDCQGCTTPFEHYGTHTIHLGCRPNVA